MSLKKIIHLMVCLFLLVFNSQAQTTYDFSTNATLSFGTGGFGIWNTQANITIGGVDYILTSGGNGSFTNSASGGVSNSKSLRKDGSGGDLFKLARVDGQPFQFYGIWVSHQSMNSYSTGPFAVTLPPWYTLSTTGAESFSYQDMTPMTAGTASNNYTSSSMAISSGSGGKKVTSVDISFPAISYYTIDNIIVGPAAAAANPVITGNPSNSSICAGGNTTFSITATGATSYQWYQNTGSGFVALANGAQFSGVTTNTLTVTGATAAMNGYQYRAVALNSSTNATSNGATLTVYSAAAITSQPSASTICAGSNTTLSATASNAIGYQWQVDQGSGFFNITNGGMYSGATTATLTITGATAGMNGFLYRVIATGTCTPNAASTGAALTVNSAAAITAQPSASTICAGANTTFSATASNATGYQWQVNQGVGFSNITNGSMYSGATTATLTITGATSGMNGYMYRVIATGTCTPSATSNNAALTVNSAPSITSQPSASTICAGANTTFSATASNATGYQWQVNQGAGFSNITNGSMYSGATTATLTITGATSGMNGFLYRVIATGTCTPSATSNNAALTVNSAPSITAQPSASTICAGANTTFSATASNATGYQWQVNQGAGFSNITNGSMYSGATTATLTITGATAGMNGYMYRVIATGTCTPSATSVSATLMVNSAPAITAQPPNSAICAGGNTTFSATASNATGYQWQVNQGAGFSNITNGSMYSGATTATLTITGATSGMNGYMYRVIATGTCTPSATSNGATLTVNSAPSITAQPSASTICAGANTTFSATASNATGYQWQVNHGAGFSNITNGGIYSGATTATLTITGATASMNGFLYRIIASGICTPSAISNSAALTISDIKTGASQVDLVCNGVGTGSASVSPSGGVGTYTFLWSTGATTSSITGLAAGIYSVTITDSNLCTVTQSFTIAQPAALVANMSSTNVSCPGKSDGKASVAVSGGVAPFTYSWSNGGNSTEIANLAEGTYDILITDSNGCTLSKQILVGTTPDLTSPVPATASLAVITRECAVTAADIPAPTANDNCVGIITATTTDALVYTEQGTYTINWTYDDGNGNTTTQQQTIVVDDVTAPVPTVVSIPTITRECEVTAADIPVPTANDNCVGIITATTTDALVYTEQGTYTINWTYNDGNGNTTTQQQTIVVDDVTAPVPVIATLPTITKECAVTAADIPAPTANDNCVGIITATTTDALVYTEQGTYTINWTYNDGNGNTTTQQQTIVVDDVTAPVPVIATLPTITKECAVTAADIPVPTANDNCVGIITATTTDALVYTEQGTYTINWTYNDGNGNTTTQQQTIVVDDVTAPVPTVATLPTITKECAVTAADIPVPTANDNCVGIITATTTDALVYTQQGTYIINWTYNDGNGNTTTQQQTIVVDDVTAPVPTVATLPTITKECAVTATDIPVPTANDNCVGIITATTTDALVYTEQGTYIINWTYNDGNGNTTTQQQTIVVDDVTAPVPTVATLPTITKECAVTAADIPVPTANDNCVGSISATTTDALVYTAQGTYTVNWTYNDGNGNTTTQQQTIVVDDVTAPVPTVVTLPKITKECAVTAADIPVPTANDNCAGVITATTTDALAYTEQGTYTINWTYNDGNGNTATQLQTVIVKDVTKPIPAVASLPTITKECAVSTADIPVPTANDNCAGVITATTTDALAYTEQGTYTINWTYNDGNGNTTTQQQTIVVDDVTAPVPTVVTLPKITKECAVTAADIPVPTANDNCAGVITATTTDALAYTEQGTYTINWTYNDGNGNTITQQQTIVVDDVTVPVPTVATLPTITKQCAVSTADIPVPTANDNCVGSISATTTDALAYTEQGTYTINWTYNDGNGNTTTQQQTIVVNDVTKPVPTVATLPTITKECAVTAADIPVPTANDNCVGIITATTTDALTYTAQGTYTINWTYNDGNGNTTTQQQTIVVDDVTKPVPTVATLPTITKQCAVTAADIPVPTANDNCVGSISATTTDALAYTEQGTYTINWTYNDGNGNTATQQQTIVVDDVTAPVPTVVTLPTITKECVVTAADIPVPTANDNCLGIISATTTDALTYTEQGTYTINWTYNDGNGNTTTQQQIIVVDDVTAPVPAVASLPTITKECIVTAADIPVPTANDNCLGIINATTTDALAYTEQGTYTINWTYNDGNGNTATQQQIIVVNDVTAPVPAVASLPTITKECAVTAADIPVPTANDNCAGSISATTTDALVYTAQGTYTVNWTYNDGNGNTTTQQQTIIVDDITKPVPAVATLPVITRECAVIAADIPVPTANDNCAGIITATTTDALTYTEQGTYTINWTYNDGNGNTFVQQQTVIVEESPLADIVLNDLTTVYDGTVHNLMVNNLPAGTAVSYSITPQAEEDNGAANAGTYTVTAVVTPPASAVNCDPVTLTAELVIEKAAQNIQFDELEVVLLETAADFQLDATASSGLPVTYTYTYDQSTPAATVSPEGWVEIVHSGSVLITAHQQGDSNYLPAASVERSLIIESKDASIQQIVVNGVVYTDPDAVIYYMMDCNDTANEVTVQIDAEFGAAVSPARDFTIVTPKPGIYRNTVEVVSENGASVQTYQIIVERPFAFDDIIVQKFDNTLLVNNNPQTNGGYRFVKYEWYRNDVLIGTEQVYSAGNSKQDILDENALYRAVLTTENGDVIHTCEAQITRKHNFKINVYPNPVHVNEQLQVVFDYPSSAFKGATAAFYTTSGKLVQSVKLNENVSSVQLPAGISEGIYMLVLHIEGRQETIKVVVKQ